MKRFSISKNQILDVVEQFLYENRDGLTGNDSFYDDEAEVQPDIAYSLGDLFADMAKSKIDHHQEYNDMRRRLSDSVQSFTVDLLMSILKDHFLSLPEHVDTAFYNRALRMANNCAEVEHEFDKVCRLYGRVDTPYVYFTRNDIDYETPVPLTFNDVDTFYRELKVSIWRVIKPVMEINEYATVDVTELENTYVFTVGEDVRHVLYRSLGKERWDGEFVPPQTDTIDVTVEDLFDQDDESEEMLSTY